MNSKPCITAFRKTVWDYWKKNGRHELAWRKTKDPYHILVSEVMLQQTQVPRVTEKYKEFLKVFPTVQSLAKAPLNSVLKAWSGLGYNRRGKYLHDAAKIIVSEYSGNIKKAIQNPLPGVGSYTRSAVRVFAFNEADILIETNIRAAFIHYFFPRKKSVFDKDILLLIEKSAEAQDPRKWNWALMDYGAYIKKSHKNPGRKSAVYVRQSKFEGSLRQARGAILRELYKDQPLLNQLSFEKERMESALAALARDGLITKQKGKWRIS